MGSYKVVTDRIGNIVHSTVISMYDALDLLGGLLRKYYRCLTTMVYS